MGNSDHDAVTTEPSGVADSSVPEQLGSPHPLVREAHELFKELKPDQNGMLTRGSDRCPPIDISVSQNTLGRALRIADMLLKEVERRGHRIRISTSGDPQACLVVNDETIGLRIREKQRRVPAAQSYRVKHGWSVWGDTELTPSGVLRLTMYEPSWSSYTEKKEWEDGPRKGTVETQINAVLGSLESFAGGIRQRRLEREEWWRQQAIREQERLRREAEQQKLDARRARLRTRAESWETCCLMRSFVDAVERAAAEQGRSIDPQSELGQWVLWAREYVESIDPLNRLERFKID